MSALAGFQDWPDVGVVWFSDAEEKRIMDYPIPGDKKLGSGRWNGRATYYPRRPVVNVGQWRRNHAEKLRSLERVAGVLPDSESGVL